MLEIKRVKAGNSCAPNGAGSRKLVWMAEGRLGLPQVPSHGACEGENGVQFALHCP